MGARTTALSVLIACRRQGAFSDGALKEYARRDGLDRRDAALAARLRELSAGTVTPVKTGNIYRAERVEK